MRMQTCCRILASSTRRSKQDIPGLRFFIHVRRISLKMLCDGHLFSILDVGGISCEGDISILAAWTGFPDTPFFTSLLAEIEMKR